jgi:ankyrin repeat protein
MANYEEQLMSALDRGDECHTISLINKMASVNFKNKGGITPLMMACRYNQYDTLVALVAKGADVNEQDRYGYTALDIAIERRMLACAEYLINETTININPKNDMTPLKFASMEGHTDLVRALLKKGADVNHDKPFGTALLIAARFDRSNVIPLLLQANANVDHTDKFGMTALKMAALHGNNNIICQLVKAGANINLHSADDPPALSYALKNNRYDKYRTVKLLIELGADVNIGFINSYDDLSCAVVNEYDNLSYAVLIGDLEIVTLLASKSNDKLKFNALNTAVKENNKECAIALLAAGADANFESGEESPLMIAVKECNTNIVKLLLPKTNPKNIQLVKQFMMSDPLKYQNIYNEFSSV